MKEFYWLMLEATIYSDGASDPRGSKPTTQLFIMDLMVFCQFSKNELASVYCQRICAGMVP